MIEWLKNNFEFIALILVTFITIYFNHRTQIKVIKFNSQIKVNERFTEELFRIRDKLADVMHLNQKSIQDLANICDYAIRPDAQQNQTDELTKTYLGSVDSNLEKSFDVELSILQILESLHTNALLYDELDIALGSLQIEYKELFSSLKKTRDRIINFDRTKPSLQQFNGLIEDVTSNEKSLNDFGMLLDDLTVIVQNTLTSKVYGKSRGFRSLDPPRRILTKEGIVDFRVR